MAVSSAEQAPATPLNLTGGVEMEQHNPGELELEQDDDPEGQPLDQNNPVAVSSAEQAPATPLNLTGGVEIEQHNPGELELEQDDDPEGQPLDQNNPVTVSSAEQPVTSSIGAKSFYRQTHALKRRLHEDYPRQTVTSVDSKRKCHKPARYID